LRPLHVVPRLFVIVAAIAPFGVGTAVLAQTASDALSDECSAYLSTPLPEEAEHVPVPTRPPSCASYRSYRGLGRTVNYGEARRCAWQERRAQQAGLGQSPEEPIAWIVGGSLILADIYFNGARVTRNVPLAMRFACEADQEMARQAVRDIEGLDGRPPARRPLEFCDHAWTTLTATFCTEYATEVEEARRTRYFNALRSSMTPEQRRAFERLLSARDTYIEAHASEVYQGGSIHNRRTTKSQAILKDLFQTHVIRFERKEWPAHSRQALRSADAWLNREYQKKVAAAPPHTAEDSREGAVAPEDLATVEKTWRAYREAWVAFARLRYPVAVDQIRTVITLERYRLVKTIGPIW
jgi:hypothetical protein